MNCREFELILADLAGDRKMDEAARFGGLAHAENCGHCTATLAEERKLLAGLRTAMATTQFENAPPRVEKELRLAFRRRAMASSNSAITPPPPSVRHRLLWALEAVALIMGALALSLLLRQRVPKSEPAQEVQKTSAPATTPLVSELPTSADSAVVRHHPTSAAGTMLAPPKRSHRPVHRNSKRDKPNRPEGDIKVMAGSPEAENTTDFLPLGYGPSSSRLEHGQIVRIKLPRLALVSFGLPMNEARAREPIEAEVVLAEDGTARAIRFVH